MRQRERPQPRPLNAVPARNERHNHAAFGGLRASRTKRCEPTRSGAVTLFVPLWRRYASLFASLWEGVTPTSAATDAQAAPASLGG
jgi:hypothetical protein